MPIRPPRICPGCKQIISTPGPCPSCRKRQHRKFNAKRPDSDRSYWKARWKRLRKSFLSRYPLCVRCEAEGRTEVAVLVDHVQPVRDGGEMWDPGNLQPLCSRCHDVKTAMDLEKRSIGT